MAKRGKVSKVQTKDEDTRPVRYRRYDLFILIVCEDEKTEPYYFQRLKILFPEETVFIREIGTGRKPKGIIEQATVEREKLSAEAKKSVDEVWVVFDKDDEGNNATTLLSFIQAWEIAEKEKIEIAFSNEVFELWLLLHFIEVDEDKPLGRKDIYVKLESFIKSFTEHQDFIYQHGNTEIIDIVLEKGNEEQATARAERLNQYHIDLKNQPVNANPSTTVSKLVRRLRNLIAWYSYIPG